MSICLIQICGYTDLCYDAEQLRKQPYSSDDASHEEKLMQVLWCMKFALNDLKYCVVSFKHFLL